MMFAFAVLPVLLLIGAAIDFSQATRVRAQLQNATDVAALSVARDGLSQPDSELPKIADKYLKANWSLPYTYKVDKLKFDRPTVTAEVDTTVKVPTNFLHLLGMKTIPVHAHSVTKGLGVEVALVLDTSGSMLESAGQTSKIAALKDATKELFKVFYGEATSSQRFTIGIVPFAASVNVGAANKSASWMDTASTPQNPYHIEDWSSPNKQQVNRFSLFKGGTNGLSNVAWAGCVMIRPAPYDINDTAPTTGSTKFVPWFAPDEPDSYEYNGKDYPLNGPYSNNYIPDDGGVCSSAEKSKTDSDAKKQGRTCKYKGVSFSSSTKGPNYYCDSKPITPLTSSRGTLETAVDALQAKGTTNILEGFMWGWRALSNSEPFTQGKAYNAPNNKKIIILMTDGVNNYSGQSNDNMSEFFAYGYAKRAHAGAATDNNNTLTGYLNNKTKAACSAAKAKGIIVYSIAFGDGAEASKPLMDYCASDPDYSFAPKSSKDLKDAFTEIAESINALRIAQ